MKRWNRTAAAVLSAALVFSMAPAGVTAAVPQGLRDGGAASDVVWMPAADSDASSQDPAAGGSGSGQAVSGSNESSGKSSEDSSSGASSSGEEKKASSDERSGQDSNSSENTDGEKGKSSSASDAAEQASSDQSQEDGKSDSASNDGSDRQKTDESASSADGQSRTSDGEDGQASPADNSGDSTGSAGDTTGSGNDSADDTGSTAGGDESGNSPNNTTEGTVDPADPSALPVTDPAADAALNAGTIISEEFVIEGEEVSMDLGDKDALFEDYANRMFYGTPLNAGKKKLKGSTAGRHLTGQDKGIYDIVKPAVADIADGKLDSAEITIPLEALGLKESYTTAELGIGNVYDSSTGQWVSGMDETVENAVLRLFTFDLSKVMHSLSADCAYELYWSDGAMGYGGIGYRKRSDNTVLLNSSITFVVGVDPDYKGSVGDYSVDTEKTGAVQTAVNTAKKIVSNADGMSDYYRLSYYREKICDLVEYNDDAAQQGENYPHKGAWALVYVFDGLPSTNVVCEGYSEAFQYLAELSTFKNSDVKVYSVTGTMAGGTGAGSHKWNIIHMDDEKNYIADITNSDNGSIGSDGKLFLKGMEGSVSNGYSKTWEEREEIEDQGDGSYTISKHPAGSISYIYDAETTGIYSEDELTLSLDDYGAPAAPSTTDDKVSLKGMSVFLTDRIGMDVYVKPASGSELEGDDYIEFTCAGKTSKQKVSEADRQKITDYNGDDIEVLEFEFELWTKQMTDEVTFHMVVDGVAGEDKTYSIREYADAILRGEYTTKEKDMVRAMLNCGGYAQEFFEYNTGNLANKDLYEADQNPAETGTDPDFGDEYTRQYSKAEDTKGFNLKEMTLALGTDVYLLYYYTLEEGKSKDNYTFELKDGSGTVDSGKTLSFGYDEKRQMNYIVTSRILPYELSDMYTLTVTPKNETSPVVSMKYGPYSYLKVKINRDTTTEKMQTLKNLCRSLYNYCEAAKTLKIEQD